VHWTFIWCFSGSKQTQKKGTNTKLIGLLFYFVFCFLFQVTNYKQGVCYFVEHYLLVFSYLIFSFFIIFFVVLFFPTFSFSILLFCWLFCYYYCWKRKKEDASKKKKRRRNRAK
jgi:hypothetical protein